MGSDNAQYYGINLPTAMVIAAFCAIAWVNTIELQARIWLTFKRYSGLYFWSLVLSSWGCALHALGFIFLDFLIIRNPHAVGVIIGVSWYRSDGQDPTCLRHSLIFLSFCRWCMVTGQALVLYSRLHLVVRDHVKIRWVLIMIITNFFILHIPIMILSQVVSNICNTHDTAQLTLRYRPTPLYLTRPNGMTSTTSTRRSK